jgi:hypothetical protein
VRIDTLVEGAAVADFLFDGSRGGYAVRLEVHKEPFLSKRVAISTGELRQIRRPPNHRRVWLVII